jgi:septum site-determining protein MinD
MGFEYIICDSPAGIEKGAQMAMYFADEAIVVANPEVSSESSVVLQSSNKGTPAILDDLTDVAQAYLDVVYRFLGEEKEHRFIEEEKRGFLRRIFG